MSKGFWKETEELLQEADELMDAEEMSEAEKEAEKKRKKEAMDRYYKNVKVQLRKALGLPENKNVPGYYAKKNTPDYKGLAKQMEQYGIYTSDQKIRAIFNEDDNRMIPLAEFMALCEILNLRIGDICNLLERPPQDSPPFSWKKNGEKRQTQGVSSLTDFHYINHEYYCYYFKTKEYSMLAREGKKPAEWMEINQVRLKLENEGGTTWATLTDDHRFVMKGRVFLIERNRQIFCRLMDEKGLRLIDLMIPYRNYSIHDMWYRTAGMLSISYNREERPLFQKMAIFRKEPNLKNPKIESMIRGILTLDSRDIMIKAEDLDALINKEPEFKVLKTIIQPEKYYTFREEDFSNPAIAWGIKEGIPRILRLRQKSELTPHEIVSDSEDMEKFFKDLQLVNFRL